jgi:hypothetical protein
MFFNKFLKFFKTFRNELSSVFCVQYIEKSQIIFHIHEKIQGLNIQSFTAMHHHPIFSHFGLQTGNWQGIMTAQYQFGAVDFQFVSLKWLSENCKLRKAILSAFYNISQRNFGILL